METPRLITDITTQWLSDLLSLPTTDLIFNKVGGGYMSEVYRLHLRPGDHSFIIKTNSSVDSTRELANLFRSYEKEHQFYAELAATISIPSPTCYYNYYDETGQFLLVLEDIGTQTRTHLYDSEIMIAAQCLADLHATQVKGHIPKLSEGMRAAAIGLEKANLEGLYQDRVEELLKHYVKNSVEFLPRFLAQPQVLSHMDFRLENLSFNKEEVTVFDWGEFSTAPRGFDLAYFAVTSMTIEQRRAIEDSFLETYISRHSGNAKESLLQSYQLCFLPAIYLTLLARDAGNKCAALELAARLSAAVEDHYDAIQELINP